LAKWPLLSRASDGTHRKRVKNFYVFGQKERRQVKKGGIFELKTKKKNPHITLKQSDVRRIKEEVTRSATENVLVLLFTVMHDKHGWGRKRLFRLFKEIEYLASMVNEKPHTVTIERLKQQLIEELKIKWLK
jgi:hypothetical protein